MKFSRNHIFIALSSVALIVVLGIQVSWLMRTAKIKEDLYAEKTNMVITRAVEALASDRAAFKNFKAGIRKIEMRKIDSLFKYYMKFYDFHFGYKFYAKRSSPQNENLAAKIYYPPAEPKCYQENLEEIIERNGYVLKLNFPDKGEFIRSEMGTLFATSVILILMVTLLFWRTMKTLLKEKQISEHTNEFLNNMTHEFKTPLTNIALAGKMIVKESNVGEEEKVKHYSGIILEENEKLRLQVEQVLSMSAFERGEILLQKTEINFHELISLALKSMHLQLENRDGVIYQELNAENAMVKGDKTQLTNVLCNLIDNAFKYTSGKPVISVKTYNDNIHLVIVISDNGIGIGKEHQKKVFDKFFRVPTGDVHDVKGFGLGLAYVKKIIAMHEGSIDLKSEWGNGASFIIKLPNG